MSKKVQVFTHTDLDGIISPVVLENVMKIAEPHTQHDFSVTYCETGSYGTIDAEVQGGGHPMASVGELPGFDALHAVEKRLLAVPEKAVSQEEQERYYQQCVERVLGNGSAAYVDFLLHCTEVDPENEAERLARKEFIGNWHDEFKSDIEEGDKKRLAAFRKYD